MNCLLQYSLRAAQSVKTGRPVVLRKSADLASCTESGSYEQGWIVFVDTDNDAVVDLSEHILRVQGPLAGEHRLVGTTDVATYIAFSSDGFARQTDGSLQSGTLTLDLCHNRSEKNTIVIKPTGRTGVEKVSCS
ncbi:GspH/FimT family protein [Halochromatium sp.]